MRSSATPRERDIVRKARSEQEKGERERTHSPSAVEAAEKRVRALGARSGVRRFVFVNGLAITMLCFFLISFFGQVLTGQRTHNQEQLDHGQRELTLPEYLRTGAFVEATMENWESEFLQMGLFVLLTAFLYQRGSSESKTIEEPDAVDQDPREARDDPEAPWPVRRGGVWLTLYKRSLGGVLLLLFAVTFVAHAAGGAMAYNDDQLQHGRSTVSIIGYMGTSQFWFESFQNWQSEFLSIAVLVVFSIFLRQRGSPESKPVHASHKETGR